MSSTHTLSWGDELVLGDARTDQTHQEFVDLVNATTAAAPELKLATYQRLLAHTVDHFEQEERWMRACGIPEDFCHFGQHAGVLQVMKEVERRAQAGEMEFIPSMIEALVEWFPGHASSMDAGLVSYLHDKGYDTTTEIFIDGAPRVIAGEGQTTGATADALPSCGHEAGTSCG
jgi:hemerythrin-like metal-binding protein